MVLRTTIFFETRDVGPVLNSSEPRGVDELPQKPSYIAYGIFGATGAFRSTKFYPSQNIKSRATSARSTSSKATAVRLPDSTAYARTESAVRVMDPVRGSFEIRRHRSQSANDTRVLLLRGCAVSCSRLARVPLGHRLFRPLSPRLILANHVILF